MKRLLFIFTALVMFVTSMSAAEKLSIKDITSGKFAAKTVNGINPIEGTDTYARISDDGKSVVGRYYFSINADREILDPFGRKFDTSSLDADEYNALCNDLDAFSEGFNRIIDGYEVMTRPNWTIRRKIVKIEYFDE